MVNPGGTGSPTLVISARPAPLPPSMSFMVPLPSADPPPKKYTYCVLADLEPVEPFLPFLPFAATFFGNSKVLALIGNPRSCSSADPPPVDTAPIIPNPKNQAPPKSRPPKIRPESAGK